jgi:hypothetical protein
MGVCLCRSKRFKEWMGWHDKTFASVPDGDVVVMSDVKASPSYYREYDSKLRDTNPLALRGSSGQKKPRKGPTSPSEAGSDILGGGNSRASSLDDRSVQISVASSYSKEETDRSMELLGDNSRSLVHLGQKGEEPVTKQPRKQPAARSGSIFWSSNAAQDAAKDVDVDLSSIYSKQSAVVNNISTGSSHGQETMEGGVVVGDWVQKFSKTNHRPYWHNSRTGMKVWKIPSVGSSPRNSPHSGSIDSASVSTASIGSGGQQSGSSNGSRCRHSGDNPARNLL